MPRGAHVGTGGLLESGANADHGTSSRAYDGGCQTGGGCIAQWRPSGRSVAGSLTGCSSLAERSGGSLTSGSRVAECRCCSRRSDKRRAAHWHTDQSWRDG